MDLELATKDEILTELEKRFKYVAIIITDKNDRHLFLNSEDCLMTSIGYLEYWKLHLGAVAMKAKAIRKKDIDNG